jgi:CHASE3 domain sensor protein
MLQIATESNKPTIADLVQRLAADMAAIIEREDAPIVLVDEIIQFCDRIEQLEETTVRHTMRAKAAAVRSAFPILIDGLTTHFESEVRKADTKRKEVA